MSHTATSCYTSKLYVNSSHVMYLCITLQGYIKVYGMEGVESLLKHPGDKVQPIKFLSFIPKKRRLVSVTSDSGVCVFDLNTMSIVNAMSPTWTVCRITAVFSPPHSEFSFLYFATDDGIIHVLDTEDCHRAKYTIHYRSLGRLLTQTLSHLLQIQ